MEFDKLNIPESMARAATEAYSAIFEARRPYLPASSHRWGPKIHDQKMTDEEIMAYLEKYKGIPKETSAQFFEKFSLGGNRMMSDVIADVHSVANYTNLDRLAGAIKAYSSPHNKDLADYFHKVQGKPSRIKHDSEAILLDDDAEVFQDTEPVLDILCVHGSDHAEEIYGHGFTCGTEPGKLAYTGGADTRGTYAFGTPVRDALRYGMWSPPWDGAPNAIPYCESIDEGGAIVFFTDGIRAYHRGDGENEVIFRKDAPDGCLWIRNVNYDTWKNGTIDDEDDHRISDQYQVVGQEPNRILFAGKYLECLEWCYRNARKAPMKLWNSSAP